MKNYYYLNERNEQIGPLTWETLEILRLSPDTLVWEKGVKNWQTLRDIRDKRSNIRHSQPTPVQMLLIVYAITGSLIGIFAGRYLAAFTASLLSISPLVPAGIITILTVIPVVTAFFLQQRRWFPRVALIMAPFLLASLFTSIYYSINKAEPYHNGQCVILKGSGVGTLNRFGMEVIPCEFDSLERWHNTDLIQARKGILSGLYKRNGEVVLPCSYIIAKKRNWTGLERWERLGPVLINQGGIVDEDRNIQGGCWGVINGNDGSILLPCKYKDLWRNLKVMVGINEDFSDWYEFDDQDRIIGMRTAATTISGFLCY